MSILARSTWARLFFKRVSRFKQIAQGLHDQASFQTVYNAPNIYLFEYFTSRSNFRSYRLSGFNDLRLRDFHPTSPPF